MKNGNQNKKDGAVNKAVLDNKLSKLGVTKKTFYSVGSLIICLLFIVVLSITQATFNGESIRTLEFWIDFAIMAGLCIFGVISGQQTGDDTARNNPNGVFRNTLSRFKRIFKTIDDLMLFAFFDEWLDIYRDKKLKHKIQGILKDNGIHQMEVLDLDYKEVQKLESPYKKTWRDGSETYFLSYTPQQIDVILFCLAGKVKVSKLPRNFFVDALCRTEKDMWESAAKSEKKKTAYLGTTYLYKIVILLAMSILSAGLTPGSLSEGGQAVIWLALIKRIFCVTTSFCWGIFVGFEIVKIDVSYLEFKCDVLNQYYQECEQKIYTPKSIEQQARESYIKEAIANGNREDSNSGETNSGETREEIEENIDC